jgi:hypothetical protein
VSFDAGLRSRRTGHYLLHWQSSARQASGLTTFQLIPSGAVELWRRPTYALSRRLGKSKLIATEGFICRTSHGVDLAVFRGVCVDRTMVMAPRIHPILPTSSPCNDTGRSRRSDRTGQTPGRPIGRRRRLQTTIVLLAGLLAFSSSFSFVSAGNNQGDDAAAAANDDAAAAAGDDLDGEGDEEDGENGEDEADQEANYKDADDDVFRWDQNVGFNWDQNVGFDGVSVMPLSCVN